MKETRPEQVESTTPRWTGHLSGRLGARLREKCPQAKVLLLGNTHFFDVGDGKSRHRVRTVNAALAKLADGRRVRFLDFSERFLLGGESLNSDLYAGDKLHLSKKGYDVWAEVMDPVLDELMK